MAGLAALAGSMKGKVGTTDISNAVQFGAVAGYLHKSSDAGWKNIETIGPNAGVESGNGNLITKLLQGEYVATYFVSGTVRALVAGDAAKVVNYNYLKDGTPLLPRAIAVTAAAGSPNAAKVFVNYLLSVEGQTAACKGGFTPYRAGVSCPFGITAIEEAVGKDNMIIGSYDPALVDQQAGIVSRWKAAFGR
jgi:iron(III) transport system substrate-binding protein